MLTAIWIVGAGGACLGSLGALLAVQRRRGAVAVLVAAGSVGVVLLFLAAIRENRTRYYDFLVECTQYRPNYECVLLWRASNRKEGGDPLIIPMLIPTGR